MKFDKTKVLETERLWIRPLHEEDAEALLAVFQNSEMFRFTPDEPWKSLEDAHGFIGLAQWLYDGEGPTFRHFFAIDEKLSGRLIGCCGVGGVAYDHMQNEVFYHIAVDSWGKGYATEAGKEMVAYAFDTLRLDKLLGIMDEGNAGSRKVMERIGLKRAGTLSGFEGELQNYNGQLLYTLTREEYDTLESSTLNKQR